LYSLSFVWLNKKSQKLHFLFIASCLMLFFPYILVSDLLFKEFPLTFLAKKILLVTNYLVSFA
jgi:hypothetical protein